MPRGLKGEKRPADVIGNAVPLCSSKPMRLIQTETLPDLKNKKVNTFPCYQDLLRGS
jgi:hypothetical protein